MKQRLGSGGVDATALDRLRTQQLVPVIRQGRIRRLVAVAAGAGLGIAVLVAGVAVLPGGGSPHGAPAPPATTTAPTRVNEPAPFTYEGTVLTTRAGRWSVGEPGDVVAVGDWRCDGRSAPALL